MSGRRYGAEHEDDVRYRIVADHVRSSLMLLSDGVTPSNEGRGYILRRLMRRSIRAMRLLGVDRPTFPELFTANTRASGASLAYQISAMVSGFTPFITTLLFEGFGWVGPALLFSGYAAIGLVAALVTRETWGPRERKLADEAAAAEPHALAA